MKTNQSPRRDPRNLVILLCLVLGIGLAIEIRLTPPTQEQLDRAAALQNAGAQVPNVSLGDALAALR